MAPQRPEEVYVLLVLPALYAHPDGASVGDHTRRDGMALHRSQEVQCPLVLLSPSRALCWDQCVNKLSTTA